MKPSEFAAAIGQDFSEEELELERDVLQSIEIVNSAWNGHIAKLKAIDDAHNESYEKWKLKEMESAKTKAEKERIGSLGSTSAFFRLAGFEVTGDLLHELCREDDSVANFGTSRVIPFCACPMIAAQCGDDLGTAFSAVYAEYCDRIVVSAANARRLAYVAQTLDYAVHHAVKKPEARKERCQALQRYFVDIDAHVLYETAPSDFMEKRKVKKWEETSEGTFQEWVE